MKIEKGDEGRETRPCAYVCVAGVDGAVEGGRERWWVVGRRWAAKGAYLCVCVFTEVF